MPERKPKPSVLPPQLCPRGRADIIVMRAIIGLLGTWQQCERACRRRKGCASSNVACFDLNIDMIRDCLEDLADWKRLDGPRDPAEAARPVGETLID